MSSCLAFYTSLPNQSWPKSILWYSYSEHHIVIFCKTWVLHLSCTVHSQHSLVDIRSLWRSSLYHWAWLPNQSWPKTLWQRELPEIPVSSFKSWRQESAWWVQTWGDHTLLSSGCSPRVFVDLWGQSTLPGPAIPGVSGRRLVQLLESVLLRPLGH